MKTKISALLLAALILLPGCTAFQNGTLAGKVSPTFTGSSAGAIGLDLNTAAQQALAAYAKAKTGGVDYVWGLQQAFQAYSTIVKTQADVKALVAAWDGTKSDTLANRLPALFGATSGSTTERMFVLAKAAQDTATALSN